MKFWQMVSIFRADVSLLRSVFEREQESAYLTWLADFNEIVRSQDRQILDSPLSERVVRKALQASRLRFRCSAGLLKPIANLDTNGQSLSALDVYLKYGGNALEDALEYGSVAVSPTERQ